MTSARLNGLYLLLLGAMMFLLLGAIAENANPQSMVDFKVVYYPGRCLIQHCDPYKESEVERISRAEVGVSTFDAANKEHIVARYIYLPSAFIFTVPFAILPWGPAHILWMSFTVGGLIVASLLIWEMAATSAPQLSGALIGLLLANSEILMMLCNAAGIAISLCVVAVWCFLRERFIGAGILCLAISLALKPQNAAFIWLYFILAGGIYRKRALQALLTMLCLSLPAILWVWYVAPHWMEEWRSNVQAFSVPNSASDPALASIGNHAFDMMINLQTVISFFWNNPRIYNPASYLIFAVPFAVWAALTLRFRFSLKGGLLALAAIAALSILPTYHRGHDAKLLLITIPACALLWGEGGLRGRLALWVTVAGLLVTGDLPWMLLLAIFDKSGLSTTAMGGRLLTAIWVFTTPIILLVVGVFYLLVYLQYCLSEIQPPQVPIGGSIPASLPS